MRLGVGAKGVGGEFKGGHVGMLVVLVAVAVVVGEAGCWG